MKSKIALALILALVIASTAFIALSDQTVSAKNAKHTPNPYHSFELTATGQAFTKSGEVVDVEINIFGSLIGKSRCVTIMFVRGGDVTVGDSSFEVEKGTSIAIERLGFFHLTMRVSSQYGGRDTVWVLKGDLGEQSGDSIPVEISASKIVLPVQGYPKLRGLNLDGQITLS